MRSYRIGKKWSNFKKWLNFIEKVVKFSGVVKFRAALEFVKSAWPKVSIRQKFLIDKILTNKKSH